METGKKAALKIFVGAKQDLWAPPGHSNGQGSSSRGAGGVKGNRGQYRGAA